MKLIDTVQLCNLVGSIENKSIHSFSPRDNSFTHLVTILFFSSPSSANLTKHKNHNSTAKCCVEKLGGDSAFQSVAYFLNCL